MSGWVFPIFAVMPNATERRSPKKFKNGVEMWRRFLNDGLMGVALGCLV